MRSNKLIKFRLDKRIKLDKETKLLLQEFVKNCIVRSSYDLKTNSFWIEISTIKSLMGIGILNSRFSPQQK